MKKTINKRNEEFSFVEYSKSVTSQNQNLYNAWLSKTVHDDELEEVEKRNDSPLDGAVEFL